MTRILFVDDDAGGRQMAVFNLRQAGYDVDEADDGRAALEVFRSDHNLVITDLKMPGLSGIELTRELRNRSSDVPVLVITAFGTIETAVEAIKAGAHDFVLKPFSRDRLLLVVDKALEHRRLRDENRALRRELRGIERPIVGESAAMKGTLEVADRVASTDATVLITGESGSGKELIARRLHARSQRADGPFIAVNCAAIPAELIEAELFGHVKGAFTGATQSRDGRFRRADGGTLFLDELGELPPGVQSKLLRVLEENVVDVLGSDQSVRVDVRFIAATNRDLQAAIEAKTFREDLYFRLAAFEITVPSLRERKDDIEALARHFVAESATRDLAIPDDVVSELKRRPWPGNVRELRNAIKRMVILASGDALSARDLPPTERPQAPSGDSSGWLTLPDDGIALLDLEKTAIEYALAAKHGNVSEAARFLRVPRHILTYRIEKHGLAKPKKN